MLRPIRFIVALVILLPWPSKPVAALEPAVAELAARIDHHIEASWRTEQVTPAPPAGDAEFLRRVHLDICGKIPLAAEVRDFLEDRSPDKRARIVEQLLTRPSAIIHATNLWRAAMIPEAASEVQLRQALPGFEAWLRSRIAENRNFAEIVEEMLTLPLGRESVNIFAAPTEPTPALFYAAKEGRPERLAAATSRLFLGVRIDCAQCHDHPFDPWKQPQFWQHAAFFTDVPLMGDGDGAVTKPTPGNSSAPPTIRIPDTDRTVTASFLDGTVPRWSAETSAREHLARWIVSDKNPYFAKAAVNRIWSYHFGIGLVEPMDDFGPNNPASHPELLEDLARAFVEHEYDFRFLIKAITASRAYQLSSRHTDPSQDRRNLFARMPVRGMTAEQIFDSLAQATGYRQPFNPEEPINFNDDQTRQEFITNFGNQAESPPDRTTTIQQALSLMNGGFIGEATNLTDSRTLAAIIDAPFLNESEKIDALCLTTLNRYPSDAERQRFLAHVSSAQAAGDRNQAYADLFWALLNSSEFLLNH